MTLVLPQSESHSPLCFWVRSVVKLDQLVSRDAPCCCIKAHRAICVHFVWHSFSNQINFSTICFVRLCVIYPAQNYLHKNMVRFIVLLLILDLFEDSQMTKWWSFIYLASGDLCQPQSTSVVVSESEIKSSFGLKSIGSLLQPSVIQRYILFVCTMKQIFLWSLHAKRAFSK